MLHLIQIGQKHFDNQLISQYLINREVGESLTNKNMIYRVQKLKGKVWEKDNDYPTIELAQSRCYELVGSQDCYTEPSYSFYGKKPEWHLDKGYFGTHNKNENWICRIQVIN